MRLRIHIFILLFFITYLAEAQSFKSGLGFGFVASQVDGDNLSGYDKIGVYGGLFVAYPINDKFDMSMQISFIQKGSRRNAKPSDGLYDSYLMRLNYVEIPVYFNWKLYQDKLYFQAGITFGYLISAVEKDEYGVIYQPSSVPQFREFELGVLGGFSYKINTRWSLGLRSQYSVIPIRKTPIINLSYYNESQNNNLITTALYYNF